MLRLVTLLVFLADFGIFLINSLEINGWYPCTITDSADQSWLSDITFECATVEAPLCHPGICTSSKTIELFVKRKLATVTLYQEQTARKSLWLLAGGPGASSVDLELAMILMYALLDSSVDVYTMDHRGTGRSSPLDCVAAQATAEGSPNGNIISLTELPYCIKDTLQQIDGHTEAFSVTSAAHDLVYLLEGLADEEDGSEFYLYGTSYGTFLVERAMHLAPPQVKGYILDGVMSEAGPDPDSRLFFSHWDYNILAPSRRFFELCLQQQETCPLQLKVGEDGDVLGAVLDIYDDIDENQNDCAIQLVLLTDSDIPSQALRPIFGLLVRDPALRELVPSILARIQRCNRNDQQELELVFGPLLKAVVQQVKGAAKIFSKLDNSKISQALETSLRLTLGSRLATTGANSIDQLEYWLISYSELWAEPSPTEDDLMEFYKGGVFSVGSAQLEQYCLLSGNLNPSLSANSRDAACFQLNLDSEDTEPTNFTQKFTYGRDEYSNRSAPVPTNASLLIINGGLDFQTPWEFGRHQFEATKLQDPGSSKKMLVEFDFGAHVCGLSVTTAGDGTLCSPGVVASFISNSGDPNAVDTSCMAELPELELNDNAFSMLVESLMEEQRDQMLAGIDYGQ